MYVILPIQPFFEIFAGVVFRKSEQQVAHENVNATTILRDILRLEPLIFSSSNISEDPPEFIDELEK